MDERPFGQICLVNIESILLYLSVKGHKPLLILPGLASLTASIGAKVEHVPDMHRPDIRALATNFLQASGNAPGASIASALRQGLLLIPLLYLLSGLFGLEGLALAHPAADGTAVLITGIMALYYYRKITRS